MDWHRLFGLVLTDFFTGSPFEVELEKDLSLKQQFLDVVIIRKNPGSFIGKLPDGLDNLADHNLISFKSYQEAFDAWTMKELLGHYVNYRKQVSPSLEQLIPEEKFRLYGICARFPTQLASQIELHEIRSGVYETKWGTDTIRLVVVRSLAEEEQNAPLQLFSAIPKQLQFARVHYQQKSPDTSSLIQRLFGDYQKEGIAVPYTMEDFRKDFRKDFLEGLSVQERLEGLSIDEVVKDLPKEVVKAIPHEEIMKELSTKEVVKAIPPEELLKELPKEEIEKFLQKIQGESSNSEK